jgi:hypothetical protein
MSALQSKIEQAKSEISSYFTPPPPAQQDSLGSGFIGLVDYFTYEGADVRDILKEVTLVIADALLKKYPRLEAREEGDFVVIFHSHTIYLNLTSRVNEEWSRVNPSAELLAKRVCAELKRQFSEYSTEPL